jgi:hypothetical protein
MTNPPQQDVSFQHLGWRENSSPTKRLKNLTCKIRTSRFITLPDITSSHKQHFPALANSTHPMQSKPHNPQTKLPELVVATEEGNCRVTKTGWQSATCNLGVLLMVVCYNTQKAKDQSGLKYRQECHHVIFCAAMPTIGHSQLSMRPCKASLKACNQSHYPSPNIPFDSLLLHTTVLAILQSTLVLTTYVTMRTHQSSSCEKKIVHKHLFKCPPFYHPSYH